MANLITVLRFPVLLLLILTLYAPQPWVRLSSAPLLVVLIGMDSVDGWVARRRHEESLLGSVLDIMVDRAVEMAMWISYAHLGLIPVAIPLICVLRGVVVDSLRSVHVSSGMAPFKAMRTPVGRWLVGSPMMRTTYAVLKLIAFAGLGVVNALTLYAAQGQVSGFSVTLWSLIFNVMSWVAVAFCLARGIPVIVESFSSLVLNARHAQDPAASGVAPAPKSPLEP